MPENFKEKDIGTKNCDKPIEGTKHPDFDYIHRTHTGDEDYPDDACERYLQVKVKFDDINVTNDIDGGGTCTFPTFQGNINVQSWKGFDIKHPNKENHRLRHICLEGPEAGVYYRGHLTGDNRIILPDYWHGLIDPTTITVSVTQIGSSQDLMVDKIEWGKTIYLKSGNASAIDCYFLVHAERKDGERLIVEYEGTSIDDYPGDNSQYTCNK